MKTLVIAAPEMLPSELAENPDVIVLDPSQLDDDMLAMLDEAAGGMLMADMGEPMPEMEGGEGALSDWAKEEEQEHGMGGFGDEDDDDVRKAAGMGDDEDEEKSKAGMGMHGRGHYGMGDDEDEEKSKDGMGYGRGHYGMGDDDEDEKKKDGMGYGRGMRSGRGGALPALASWARAMGGRGR